MTDKIKELIAHSNYLVDYEARKYTALDHKKTPEEIYEQLCNDEGLNEPYALDVDNFEDWVNDNYTAFEILRDDTISMNDLEEDYRQEIVDPAVEAIFTDPGYFAWL